MKEFSPRMALMPGLIALATLFSSLKGPRVAALHGAEVVGLLGAGFGIGATFTLLLTWYLRRKERRPAE
jgi:hypothetical protein